MGLIRGGLVVILSVLLFVSFLAGGVFLTLSMSLDIEELKPEIVSMVKKDLQEREDFAGVDENFYLMEEHCQNNSEFVFEDNDLEEPMTIPCSVVDQGSDAVIDYSINELVDRMQEGEGESLGEVGKFANQDYWKSKFYLDLVVAIVLFVGLFFLVENKSNSFVIAGILLIVASLPFMKIEWFFSLLDNDLFRFLSIAFSEAYAVFIYGLIAGFVVLGVGIVLKFFGIGFKISNFISKTKGQNQKKLVKQVVKEQNKMQKPFVNKGSVNRK